MQLISDTVGDKGRNKASDVALVQAILLKTARMSLGNNPQSKTYLASYDGECGDHTVKAIREFQTDYVNVTPDGRQCTPNPGASAALVRPGDATWTKLLEKVDPAFSDMRILADAKTVYVAAPPKQFADALASVEDFSFAEAFRPKVRACLNTMYLKSGIAISVCRQGGRRTFQEQQAILLKNDGSTHAGPGESNHNYGMAVDLGFKGLQWLKKNGTVEREPLWWLAQLGHDHRAADALKFWALLRRVGTSEVGLFRGPEADRPHLQNWDDHGVDMANRLAALMTRFGTMKWQGHHQKYSCDFALGGDFYPVGTASQIWDYQGAVTIANLNAARAAASSGPDPVPPATPADVTAMQEKLRADFQTAESHWQDWTSQ